MEYGVLDKKPFIREHCIYVYVKHWSELERRPRPGARQGDGEGAELSRRQSRVRHHVRQHRCAQPHRLGAPSCSAEGLRL